VGGVGGGGEEGGSPSGLAFRFRFRFRGGFRGRFSGVYVAEGLAVPDNDGGPALEVAEEREVAIRAFVAEVGIERPVSARDPDAIAGVDLTVNGKGIPRRGNNPDSGGGGVGVFPRDFVKLTDRTKSVSEDGGTGVRRRNTS
jgi:hypothetical protein